MISKSGKTEKGGPDSKQETVPCPMCGAKIPKDTTECPKCEEPFTPEAFLKIKQSKGTKLFFWSGLMLTLAGGGLALGSWLHDLLDLDFVGDGNPGTFGPFNRKVALIGIIILVIGIIFLILFLSKMEKVELGGMELNEEKENQGG